VIIRGDRFVAEVGAQARIEIELAVEVHAPAQRRFDVARRSLLETSLVLPPVILIVIRVVGLLKTGATFFVHRETRDQLVVREPMPIGFIFAKSEQRFLPAALGYG